jgi:hypothetical protein
MKKGEKKVKHCPLQREMGCPTMTPEPKYFAKLKVVLDKSFVKTAIRTQKRL